MIIHLSSNDPNNYGRLAIHSSSIGKLSQVVRYRVVSVSTMASFSITTPEDYLKIKCEGLVMKFSFPEHGPYDMYTLASELTECMKLDSVEGEEGALVPTELPINELIIDIDNRGLLRIEADKEFEIVEATHRVKLLLGMYHSKLPISSKGKIIVMESVPLTCLGNILYLTPRTDAVCITNARGEEETHSIVYKLNEILYNGFPVNCKLFGEWYTIQLSELQTMEFILTDFMLEPIILHAPLHMTLEIMCG